MNTRTLTLIPLTILFLLVLQYPQAGNLGGSGFGIVTNIIFSAGLALLFGLNISVIVSERKVKLTQPFFVFLILGSYSAVNFFTMSSTQDSYGMYILGVLSCALMIFVINSFTAHQKKSVLLILLIAILAQMVLGVFQVYFPSFESYYKFNFSNMTIKPFGVFYQQNVYASFIATGVAIALYFIMILPKWSLRYKKAPLILSFTVLAFAPALLLLTLSRTAILSLLLLLTLTLLHVFKTRKNIKAYLFSVALVILSSALIISFPPENSLLSPTSISAVEAGSNTSENISVEDQVNSEVKDSALADKLSRSSDIRTKIYTDSTKLLLETPWLGVGYGNFYSKFIDYENRIEGELQGLPLRHPHNILLYLWANSGLFSVLLVVGYAVYFMSSMMKCYRNRKVNSAILWLLTPISLHALLELPFSHSMPHLIVFSIFIGLIHSRSYTVVLPQVITKILIAAVSITSIIGFYQLQNSLSYSKLMQGFDRIPVSQAKVNIAAMLNIIDFSQFGHYERSTIRYYNAVFYKMMSTNDKKLAYQYSIWARKILRTVPTAVLYQNLSYSFYVLGDKKRGREFYDKSLELFPNDKPYPQLQKLVDSQNMKAAL